MNFSVFDKIVSLIAEEFGKEAEGELTNLGNFFRDIDNELFLLFAGGAGAGCSSFGV